MRDFQKPDWERIIPIAIKAESPPATDEMGGDGDAEHGKRPRETGDEGENSQWLVAYDYSLGLIANAKRRKYDDDDMVKVLLPILQELNMEPCHVLEFLIEGDICLPRVIAALRDEGKSPTAPWPCLVLRFHSISFVMFASFTN